MTTFFDWKAVKPLDDAAKRAWAAERDGYTLRVEHFGGHRYTTSVVRPDGNRLDDLLDVNRIGEVPHGYAKAVAEFAAQAFEWSRDVAEMKDVAIERVERDLATATSATGLVATPAVMSVRESAYRRGFMQGGSYVLRRIAEGVSPKAISVWLAGPILRWRYRTPRDQRVEHPELDAAEARV